MDKQLILVSHGTLCEELKKSTEMIMGAQPAIHTVALLPEEGPADFLTKFKAVTKDLDDFLVMADLMGGTPCNIVAKELMLGAQFDLYAGMNMPMVISFINAQMTQTSSNFLEDAQSNIYYVNEQLLEVEEDE
ncbi:PTS fructose transporter subunit IIA [Enterococcus sp. JM4C]|uniref:PTS sugar transporter subunit IIA n=1 Tax=Candidatus Enterococcus huntleyi TaxID=1857217 RepID=UPI00137A0F79|nr:PTS fructose transporter subunit IIA [Enterococcus sp. JM4C]KAF1295683.1 PTS fructose transporter subunit IIA [Enterococcus sp. JM4C]